MVTAFVRKEIRSKIRIFFSYRQKQRKILLHSDFRGYENYYNFSLQRCNKVMTMNVVPSEEKWRSYLIFKTKSERGEQVKIDWYVLGGEVKIHPVTRNTVNLFALFCYKAYRNSRLYERLSDRIIPTKIIGIKGCPPLYPFTTLPY